LEEFERGAKKAKNFENALKEELNIRENDMNKKNEIVKNLQNEVAKLNDDLSHLKKNNLILQSGNEFLEDIKNKFINNYNFDLKENGKNLLGQINDYKNKIIDLESTIKIIDQGRYKYFKLNLEYQSKINNFEKELEKKRNILQEYEQKLCKRKKIIGVKKKVNLILVDLVKCKKNELQCLEAIKIVDSEKIRNTLDSIRRNEKNYLLK
jgi:uncharacterized protein (DUF3084 family)